ncbi:MAG: hypothetical protein A3H06_02510 [Candidatus Colwellbacteria bacterium RIFCSPLOWO2_12_FULL_44_13]|uniref:Ion transport domain-containing protein n=3 Tax=Candidatus Colwelliibacteriota TaxID=1817904 RepID=A0A1G1Z6J9_9BACT|nr:MAG: hypothetical protein A3F24_03110 [Candidatus Colwellbacteria bacterium RIFCSPHIGHO2_12_FULL_44_17]OGY60252.1 MAG: hypothetical protein A3I31_00730 [Candidatus Colwellbacteria bacterium RIFCSPLOWO2_02_FULL_44_20b]OGY62060.1 MAG: hypothetical protein A3H06_02510 [Candidatus Colwellbacteria bacterium RIFCSPLOWO2_12_FULL_44_13]
MKNFCYKAFYNQKSKLFLVINNFLSIVIIFSVLAIILESIPSLHKYVTSFLYIEYICVAIFSVEYIGRVIGAPKKHEYIFSFFGLIDIVSIIPTLLGAGYLAPLKLTRELRILRFLRILRLIKVIRVENHQSRKGTSEVYKLDFGIYIAAFISVVVILASLLHALEHNNPGFESIPITILWIVGVVLENPAVSIFPQTYAGVVITLLARLTGLVLFGVIIHFVGIFIRRLLLGNKKISRERIDDSESL